MDAPSRRSRYVLPLAYLIAGVVWVVGSDALLDAGASADLSRWTASAKGVMFVLLSAVLLFAVQAWPATRHETARRHGRRPWRALLLFLVCAASVALFGYSLFDLGAQQVRQRAAAHLQSSAAQTARQVEVWVTDRRDALAYVGTNAAMEHEARHALAGDPQSVQVLAGAVEVIARADDFEAVEVLTPRGESLVGSGARIALTPELARYVERAHVTGRVVMSDLYVPTGAADGRPVVDFVVTLEDGEGAGMLGILVARADPERFLTPALQPSDAGPATPMYGLARRTSSGKIELATGDGVAAGQPGLRFVEAAAASAAAQIVAGRRGVFEAADYRGVPVLAVGHPIEQTPWYLVAKSNRAEVYAPMQRLARTAVFFALAGLAVAALLVTLWWRSERFELAARADEAERRARVLQEHFAVAGRLVNDLVLLIDAEDARILEANDRAIDAYGYSRDELLQKTTFDLHPSGSIEARDAPTRFAAIVRNGHGAFRVDHLRRDGTPLPLEVSARTVTIDGRTYLQAIGRDISERLEHEARVAAMSSERERLLERMQLQFERMASACLVVSPDGRLLQVNPAFERTFGYGAAAAVGMRIDQLMVLPRFREEALERFGELLRNPDQSYSGVHENVTAQGKGIVCRWSAAALHTADGTVHGVIAMADDITEIIRVERALRSSEARYRALTEVSPVGIFRASLKGDVVFGNPRAREITGFDAAGMPAQAWVRVLHPDDTVDVIASWTRYLEQAGRRGGEAEFRVVRPDGKVVWVLSQVRPEFDGDRQLVGHIGTITDVTAIKQAQLELQEAHRLLEQRVRERTRELEAAKNAAEHSDRVKTTFLSTMSHELRTPLNAILGFTDVVLERLSGPLTEEQARQLGIVRDSAAHLRALVEDVLDISSIEAGQVGLEYASVDLRELVERQLRAFAPDAARKGLRLAVAERICAPSLRSDGRRIGQIVANLLSNAVKFTDAGQVEVDVRLAVDRVEIVVEDSGVGIPPASLGSIFEPFVQVARPGGRLRDGTGLGLAISRNLARALGGDIEVASELGRGSRFIFWLPTRTAIAA